MSGGKRRAIAGTPATAVLAGADVPFTTHAYDHDPASGSYGTEAAEALGVPAGRVFIWQPSTAG